MITPEEIARLRAALERAKRGAFDQISVGLETLGALLDALEAGKPTREQVEKALTPVLTCAGDELPHYCETCGQSLFLTAILDALAAAGYLREAREEGR